MAPEFFFSYARSDGGPYLVRFFEDLCGAVRARLGLSKQEEVGFLDVDQERGEDWGPRVGKALQEAKVLVAVYSPAYFRSAHCGREWEVFRRRRDRAVEAAADGADLPPPVIKPVIWVPQELAALPQAVRGIQYTAGDPEAVTHVKGLRYVTRLISRHETELLEYVETLADEIVAVAREHPLPPLDELPPFLELPNAFEPPPEAAGAGPGGPGTTPDDGAGARRRLRSGPRFVHFVFVAGSPDELKGVRVSVEAYGAGGGREWLPYYPETDRPIRLVAQEVASERGLDLFSEEMPCEENLADLVSAAEENRDLVVLIVDRWTLGLQKYRDILKEFDGKRYFNCSVLVPLNEKDPETKAALETLERHLQAALFRLSQGGETTHFRRHVRSAEELTQELRSVLVRLRAQVVRQAEVSRPIPPGRPLTLVHGPGGTRTTP